MEPVLDVAMLVPNGIPKRFATATLAGIKSRVLHTIVRAYGKGFWELGARGVAPFFCGVTQSYKTYSAAVVAQAVTNCLVQVGWCHAPSEFVQFERNMYAERTQQRIEYLKAVSFLVMDDFAQLKQGSRQLDFLVEVGTTRFDALLPTLYTGNLQLTATDSTELVRAVGPALARRILEASENYRVCVRAKAP